MADDPSWRSWSEVQQLRNALAFVAACDGLRERRQVQAELESHAARQAGPGVHVIAIEPNLEVIARLERNVRINGLDGNCTVVSVAIRRHPRSGSLIVGANTTIGSLAEPKAAGVGVPVATLDEIVCGADMARIDLMKVGVEGSEVDVPQGRPETIDCCRQSVLEVSDANSDQVSDELARRGFGRVLRVAAGHDSGGGREFGQRDPH
jgi:FkbM family methyltransferase